jgi:Ran GTPase-activating protein (RanGAP) involved in mRNA processing and transport
MSQRFSTLRRLLNESPRREHWEALWLLFLTWPEDAEKSLALDYAQQHLEHWAREDRHLTSDQLKRLADLAGLYKTDQSLSQFWQHPAFVPLWPLLRSLHTRYSLWHARDVEHLGAWSGLAHLDSLVMEGESLGNSGFARLVKQGALTKVRSLTLAFNQVQGSAWKMQDSPEPWALEHLSLRDNSFQPSELSALLRSPKMSSLRSLSLEGDAVRFEYGQLQEMGAALADGPTLESLRLRALRDWPGSGLQLLLRGLGRDIKELTLQDLSLEHWFVQQNTSWLSQWSLRSLDLSGNAFPFEDILELGQNQGLGTLEELRLERCSLCDEGLTALTMAPMLTGLKRLSLANNSFGDRGTLLLLRSALVQSLESLELDLTHCSEVGIQGLCRSPLLGKMKTLRLGEEVFSPTTAALLSQTLGTDSLECLDLSDNTLSPLLTELMVQSRGFSSLRTLRLQHCQLTPDLLNEWSKAPWWSQLRVLDLSQNPLQGLDVGWLLDSAPALEECHLEHCELSAGALSGLSAMSQSSRVHTLSLGHNWLGSEDVETLLAVDSLPALVTLQLRGNTMPSELRKKLFNAFPFPRYNLMIESPSATYLR